MANFTGKLNSNEIFAALYNMIISQEVFTDNISGTDSELVDRARVDGGLYGDTKLYYATDVLKSAPWGNDAEAQNLLALHRPSAPECQAITLDKFRQISLTVDNYLSKRAWGTESAFSNFNNVMLGWIRETKRIYDASTYNAYLGTAESSIGKQKRTVNVTSAVEGLTGEEKARVEAQVIAEDMSKLMVDLKDYTRDYNDYQNLRSYKLSDLIFVFNADAVAKIEKRDLPTIFHKDIIEQMGKNTLPSRFFGKVNAAEATGNGTTIRSLIEQDIGANHYFAGDLIKSGDEAPAGTSYTVDPSILYKVIHKRSIPFMSAFEVGTSFFNPKSLTENRYLTWGHNTLEYLKNYPIVTVRQA